MKTYTQFKTILYLALTTMLIMPYYSNSMYIPRHTSKGNTVCQRYFEKKVNKARVRNNIARASRKNNW